MKPFNLEEAKVGKPVVTREGIPVRMLCFDGGLADDHNIIYIVKDIVMWVKSNGCYSDKFESVWDLFMKPLKQTVWVNVYNDSGRIYTLNSYATQEEALLNTAPKHYLKTISIEVEV